MATDQRKRQRTNPTQMAAMVDLLGENPGMASGKFMRLHGKVEYHNRWREMAEKLNAMGGAVKTAEQWQTAWKDLKSRISVRCRERNKQQARTGNAPIEEAPLTQLEMRVLDLIGVQYVEGNEGVPDTMPFEEQHQVMMEEGQEFPRLVVTPTSENGAPSLPQARTPRTPAVTPRAPKRKSGNDDLAREFMEVAKAQAAAVIQLAENSNKVAENSNRATEMQADALKDLAASNRELAESIKVMGEQFSDYANAIYLLAGNMADRNKN